MTRKKVQLAYIVNDSARKATYKKRKKGLIKKVSELSTLCDISVCAIIYSPYDPKPEIWPTNAQGVRRVLADFMSLPHMERTKKMVNQDTFLRQMINKSADQLKKLQRDNREKQMTQVMSQCLAGNINLQNLNVAELSELNWIVDQKLKEIQRRQASFNKTDRELGAPVEQNIKDQQQQESFMTMMNPPQEYSEEEETVMPWEESKTKLIWFP